MHLERRIGRSVRQLRGLHDDMQPPWNRAGKLIKIGKGKTIRDQYDRNRLEVEHAISLNFV
jgi:hypothetical protein